MGDEHDGRARCLPDLQQIVVELEPRDLVERGERLIHQEKLRLGDERARDRDAHAHAAGQFARKSMAEILQPDPVERRDDARTRFFGRRAFERQRQQDIVEHRRPGHQRGFLEDKAERDFAAGLRRRRWPVDGALRRLAQARDNPQCRRFSAARRAEKRHEFVRPDVEIEILERERAVRKCLADAA